MVRLLIVKLLYILTAMQELPEHGKITNSTALRVDITELQEALIAFFLMSNSWQKNPPNKPGALIIIIFKPNVNQTKSTTMPGGEVESESISFGFSPCSNSQNYFNTDLLPITSERQMEKRLWKKLENTGYLNLKY